MLPQPCIFGGVVMVFEFPEISGSSHVVPENKLKYNSQIIISKI